MTSLSKLCGELFSRLLTSWVRRLISPEWGFAAISIIGGRPVCVYVSTHKNFGFFSVCSTSLVDVLRLQRNEIVVDKIDFSRSMQFFKDTPGKDIYPEVFQFRGSTSAFGGLTPNAWDVHALYKELPLEVLHSAARAFFEPSLRVRDMEVELLEEAQVVPDATIAVYYRGTDKDQEIQLAALEDYIRAIECIDGRSGAAFDILIQTDQAQARQAVTDRFGARARYFESLPVTSGSTGIHHLDFEGDLEMSREWFAMRMLAAVVIMSKCAYVIATTSNVGAWIAFYRGNARNLYQFDEHGTMVPPD